MNNVIQVLVVEDLEADALVTMAELRRAGFEVSFERVCTSAGMREALERKTWDLILSDFTMPNFNGTLALSLAQEFDTDAPFIYVSGTIRKDVAIKAMRSGARDFIMKTKLARLAPVVHRELDAAKIRRDSRLANAAMRESEHKYRHLFESFGAGMFSFDERPGQIPDESLQAERLLGRTHTELLASNHAQLFAPQTSQTAPDALVPGADSKLADGCELGVVGKDRSVVPLHAAVSKIEAAGKHLMWSQLRDVSEGNRMKDALDREMAFLVEQMKSSQDGIMMVHCEKSLIVTNPRMLQLWNIPANIAESLDGQELLQFMANRVKAPQKFTAPTDYSCTDTNEIGRDEIELEDGTILERSSSPVIGREGTLYGRIWTFRDISELKRLEEQLRHVQKLAELGQLTGGVIHDFNNILTAIVATAQSLLLDADSSGSPAKIGLEDIFKAAINGADLTRQLLLFGRGEKMQSTTLNVDDLITNLIRMLQRILGAQIQLEYRCEIIPSFVDADAGIIERVLLNLILNARDAMPRGGSVRITTEKVTLDQNVSLVCPKARAGIFVSISVSDTGTGISPEVLPRIFEPFFTTKQPCKGTGLGLATVVRSVEDLGGWVEVSSRVGTGTTFKVCLPVSSAAG